MLQRIKLAVAVAITSVVLATFVPSAPAGALTGNEKFTMAVYQDYLFRAPSADELTWWTTYLSGGGTRTSVAANVLASDEFKSLWVLGASQYYLGGIDSLAGPVTATLVSNGDFVASEVSLIAGTTYFSQSGGTNTAFVQNVYQDVLLRAADTAGLNYWVGRLNAGTSTRSSVANAFIRTIESANRRVAGTAGMTACSATTLADVAAIPAGSYCIVLDRLATASDVSYWAPQLSGTSQLPSLWSALAGSTEYYNSAQLRF